ncbi:MAG: hypothetical protein LWW91_07345 [Bacteroidales bacterium]|nr:hypothetical protein [Bacteroidales bacterium]
MQNTKQSAYKGLSLTELLELLKVWWKAMLNHWLIIVIVGLSGGALGLGASFLVKPSYTAHLSFALIEKTAGGGLASLAASFGFGGLSGGGGSAFSGDNLLQILQSRYAVESTLLSPVHFNGTQMTMMDAYAEFMDLKKGWQKSKDAQVQQLSYPVGQARESFTRAQDSVLNEVYTLFVKSNLLKVNRRDKKISIVTVDFKSKNEQFSKLFVEKLMDRTYEFYKDTRTSQSRVNIDIMQHTADSIRNLYETAMQRSAGISQVNINQALSIAAVPRMKYENEAQMYAAVYGEVLKNLETLKLDLARETPLVQLIDTPRYPLKKDKLGKLKGVVLGGLLAGMLIVAYLTIRLYFSGVFTRSTITDLKDV